MSEVPAPQNVSPDDVLPPVEPPSAGFLLQLFIIPGIIVAIIVLVYWGVQHLAHGQANPMNEVKKIRRQDNSSWQAASALADQLRNPADRSLRKNAELAEQVADILQQQIEAGGQDRDAIALRYFLCRALGEFDLPTGLPVLLTAAKTDQGEHDHEVRLAALEAIALLGDHLRDEGGLKHPELIGSLMAASRDKLPAIRSRAAFALGTLSDPDGKLQARMIQMLADPYPDARYNAATRLAVHGRPESIDVLLEMLEPPDAAVRDEIESAQASKRTLIVINGMRSIGQLAEHNPDADLSEAHVLIDQLCKSSDVPIRLEAEKLKQQLTAAATAH